MPRSLAVLGAPWVPIFAADGHCSRPLQITPSH